MARVAMESAPPGTKVRIPAPIERSGVWLKLEETAHPNALRGAWVNLDSGRVLHFSWLASEPDYAGDAA